MSNIDIGPSTTPAAAVQEATKVLFVSTPTDRALSSSEGSSIWAMKCRDLGEQVDELVREGRVTEAIGLVEAVGEAGLSPVSGSGLSLSVSGIADKKQNRRLPHLQTLLAVQQFAASQFQSVIDTFLTYNINPALVISLYPAEIISGKSHVSRNKWMELFGAVEGARLQPETSQVEKHEDEGFTKALLGKVTGLGLTKKRSTDTLRTGRDSREKEDDTFSAAESDKVAPAIPVEERKLLCPSPRRWIQLNYLQILLLGQH
jgi:phage gp46-like protein